VFSWEKNESSGLDGRWVKSKQMHPSISLVIDELLTSTMTAVFSNTSKRTSEGGESQPTATEPQLDTQTVEPRAVE
jgi:hypothetical protein